MRLIQDVKRLDHFNKRHKRSRPLCKPVSVARQQMIAAKLDEQVLITELFVRNITIEHIFGSYYAIEEQMGAHDDEIFGNDEEGLHGKPTSLLKVKDAMLVMDTKSKPIERNPF